MSISKPVFQSQLAFHCMFLCSYIDSGEFHMMDLQTYLSSYHRCFKRYSKSSLNRQQEVAHYSTPPQLRLVDYLQKKKEKKGTQQYDLKISKAGNVSVLRHRWVNFLAIYFKDQHTNTILLIFQCVDMWKQNPCYLTAPSEVDVSLVVTFCTYQQLQSVVLYEEKEVTKYYPISNFKRN